MKKRFTEEQIVQVLKEHHQGLALSELCRKHNVSSATVYKWKNKYGGLDGDDVRKMKGLEDENHKLKKIVANLLLENDAIKSVLEKKW